MKAPVPGRGSFWATGSGQDKMARGLLLTADMSANETRQGAARGRFWRRLGLASLIGLFAVAGACASWLLERPYQSSFADEAASLALPSQADQTDQLDQETVVEAPAVQVQLPVVDPLPRLLPEPKKLPARPKRFLNTENTLVLGLDRNRGVIRGGRTDTILIAVHDAQSEHLGIISVPRDLYVDIEGHGKNRINAVYGLAQLNKQDPLKAVERVIQDTLGIPISHSLVVDLQVFERVVDALGGVTVPVQCPIEDNFIDPRVEGGRRQLSLKAGPQQMDGPTASMFIRSRHGRSDWSRARRQQLVLMGAQEQLSTVTGILRVPQLLTQVEKSVVTDMTRMELLTLAQRLLRVKRSHIHGVVLGHKETSPFRTERKWSVLLPDEPAIEKRLDSLFAARSPGARPLGVECPPADAALQPRKGFKRKSKAATTSSSTVRGETTQKPGVR